MAKTQNLHAENFFKMSSAGNSYIYAIHKKLSDEKIKELSKKYLTDGVVVIYQRQKQYGFCIYNKDASKARFCGNAAMCVAKYLYDNKLKCSSKFKILSSSGAKKVWVFGGGKNQKVRVEVGYPHFLRLNGSNDLHNNKPIDLIINGKQIRLVCSYVWVGNKHLVVFNDFDLTQKMQIFKALQTNRLFSGGVNVEFVKIKSDKITVDVYERGSGRTLSCGSGAAACFFAVKKSGFKQNKADIIFEGGIITAVKRCGKIYIQSKPIYENMQSDGESK